MTEDLRDVASVRDRVVEQAEYLRKLEAEVERLRRENARLMEELAVQYAVRLEMAASIRRWQAAATRR